MKLSGCSGGKAARASQLLNEVWMQKSLWLPEFLVTIYWVAIKEFESNCYNGNLYLYIYIGIKMIPQYSNLKD